MKTTNLKLVTAGAGSGKTHRLTSLLGEGLRSGRIRPAAILATTFTVKAADELLHRVRSHLLADGLSSEATALGQSYIGTVNGVAGRLLSRFAFEAGLSPNLEVLAESSAELLFQKTLLAVASSPQAKILTRLGQKLGVEDWRQDVKAIVDGARASGIPRTSFAEEATASFAALKKYLPTSTSAANLETRLPSLIDDALAGFKTSGDTTKKSLELVALLEEMRDSARLGRLTWKNWASLSKKEPAKKSAALFADVIEAAASFHTFPSFAADVETYIRAAFELASEAWAQFNKAKAELGLIDFQDQEAHLLSLLELPHVAAELSEELDLLLVDEFQDTSPIQFALFLKLASLAKETVWVGDVKQAIYGFRGADPSLILSLLEELKPREGALEALDKSWRSRPPLVSFVNEVFRPAFANTLDANQVELNAARSDAPLGECLEFWNIEGSNQAKRAAALAQALKEFLDAGKLIAIKGTSDSRPLEGADVAILVRKNDEAENIAKACRAIGVPVNLAAGGLRTTPEAALIEATLRRLLDRNDTLATAEIITLHDSVSPEAWLDERLAWLDSGHRSCDWKLDHPIISRIESARMAIEGLSPKEAIDLAITLSGVEHAAHRWSFDRAEADQRLANIEAMRSHAKTYETDSAVSGAIPTVSGFLAWFQDQAKAKKDACGTSHGKDAIHILTYHKAKGLEWPVVICGDLDKKPRPRLWGVRPRLRRGAQFSSSSPLANRTLIFWPGALEDLLRGVEDSPDSREELLNAIEEEKRLLYVGFTRARDCLILLKGPKDNWNWLKTAGAAWIEPASELTLPSGKSLAAITKVVKEPSADVVSTKATPQTPLSYWPERIEKRTERLPARLVPSGAPALADARSGRLKTYGTELPLTGSADMATLGRALHFILARELLVRDDPRSLSHATEILARLGLEDVLDAKAAHLQAQAFSRYVYDDLGASRVLVECPMSYRLDNGQIVPGWIDLLVETRSGWILIDHKALLGRPETILRKAVAYSGQLSLYEEAVLRATGRPVVESWIHLVLAGSLVEVLTRPETVADDRELG